MNGKISGKSRPDFIIGGAPKCGTTSLHRILESAPEIFIPREVFFFDLDEFRQHPAHFPFSGEEWIEHDFERDFDRYWEWYQSLFSESRPDQLVGEDSPTYITSRKAPARIRELLPEVKLIFVLRDPVDRIYSHYWNDVSHGRRMWSFEKSLSRGYTSYLEGSYYEKSLRRYLRTFPESNIKVVIFEEFVARTQEVVDEILEFLEVDSQVSIDLSQVNHHHNKSKAPYSLTLKLLANRLRHQGPQKQRLGHLPGLDLSRLEVYRKSGLMSTGCQLAAGALEWLLEPLQKESYPPMNEGTREFLNRVFRRENAGLEELLGRDLSSYWGCFSTKRATPRTRESNKQVKPA